MADAWTTVVEVEPEWDDETRTLVEALDKHDHEVHACGLHSSVLADPENNRFRFEVDHCEMCAAIAVRARVMADEDAAWNKAHPDLKPRDRRPSDGRSLRLRPMTPDEIQQTQGQEVSRGRQARSGPGRR